MSYEKNQFLDFSESQRLELLKSLFVAYTINSDEVISNYRDFEPSESGKSFINDAIKTDFKILENNYATNSDFKEFAANLVIIEFFYKLDKKFLSIFDLYPNSSEEYRETLFIDDNPHLTILKDCIPADEFINFKTYVMSTKAFDCILYALEQIIKSVGSFERWAKFID